MFHDPLSVLLVLILVPAFFFFLETRTKARLFHYLPPLLWIYATPLFLQLLGLMPEESTVYDGIKLYLLPVFITLLVMSVDLKAAIRATGRALPLMAIATLGIMVGGPVSYLIVHPWLGPDAWTGIGALAGSWIGGTGNMAAAAAALEAPEDQYGLAIVADQAVYLIWLPLLIISRSFADRFNRWTKAEPLAVYAEAPKSDSPDRPPMVDVLLILGAALLNSWAAFKISPLLPVIEPVLFESTWRIVLITTGAIGLSFTPLRRSLMAEPLGGAILYIFVATIGASASLGGLGQAPVFVLGAFIWISIHGAFLLTGAKLLRMDVHTLAIASAANVGGAASAPVVAAAHNKALVPLALLLAMIGYVFGNYLAILTGHMARLIAG